MWRKAMIYLGLGPDEEYDDYEPADERPPERDRPATAPSRYPPSREDPGQSAPVQGSVRTIPSVRPQASGTGGDPARRPQTAVVRPLPAEAAVKPEVIAPATFNDTQEVADRLKENQPVILNLENVDGLLRRRLIDFAAGLVYGIGGHMEKVSANVLLLSPANVSAEDRLRLRDHDYLDG